MDIAGTECVLWAPCQTSMTTKFAFRYINTWDSSPRTNSRQGVRNSALLPSLKLNKEQWYSVNVYIETVLYCNSIQPFGYLNSYSGISSEIEWFIEVRGSLKWNPTAYIRFSSNRILLFFHKSTGYFILSMCILRHICALSFLVYCLLFISLRI